MAVELRDEGKRQNHKRCPAQSHCQIVADARPVLGWLFTSHRALVVPNMDPGQEHDFISCIHQAQREIFFLTAINSGGGYVTPGCADGGHTDNVATTDEHRHPSWLRSAALAAFVGSEDIKSNRRDLRMRFEVIHSHADFISIQEPG